MNFEILDTLDEAYGFLNPSDLTLTYANSAFWKWLGIEPEKKSIPELFAAFNKEKYDQKIAKPGIYTFETETKPKEGRSLPVEYTLQMIESQGNKILKIHGRSLSRLKEKDLMLKSFTQIIDTNNKLLKRQKEGIENLLNSMKQAVFAINSSGKIIDPVSKFSNGLFGCEISGVNIFEALYRNIDKKSEEFAAIQSALNGVFGEGDLQWSFQKSPFQERFVI